MNDDTCLTPPTHFVIPPPPRVHLALSGGAGAFAVRRVYCVGRNYAEHVREMGADEREPPFFFQKPTDAIVRDGALVDYPSETTDLQHEVELVLAIGTGGSRIPVDSAARHVFGFTVGIDLTRRDRQIEARKAGRPWEIGKSFDQSAPCGDLVPCAVQPLPAHGLLRLSVNGQTRQSADLDRMIWNPLEVICRLSHQYRLESGDLVFTGTPAGVGPVSPGDTIEATLGHWARLTVRIRPQE